MANHGHIIKEYLAEQGIPTAQKKQCTERAQCRSKQRLTIGKVSFPMYHPVLKLKEKVVEKIEIYVGIETVKTTESRYTTREGELITKEH